MATLRQEGPPAKERPLGDLFAELARETGELVQQEVRLAKVELTQKVTDAAKKAAWVGLGGLLAHAGVLALVGALILLVGQAIPLWVSALLVGAAAIAGGYVFAQKGLKALKELDLTPRQTIQTLKEDRQWARQQIQ